MAVDLNHLIVFANDKHEFANFLALELSNGVTLDYAEPGVSFPGQHYAFLVSEEDFDACLSRLQARGAEYFADPHGKRPGELNTNDGGRGLYFIDPSRSG